MKLFRIEEYIPIPTEECQACAPFQELLTLNYNKAPGDVDGRKRIRGNKELRYIYFSCDYRSEFANFSDKERRKFALKAAGLPQDYKLSTELESACVFYMSINSSRSIQVLESARKAVDEIRHYFNSVDITVLDTDSPDEKDRKFVLAGKLMDNLGKLPTVLKKLEELEEKVKKDESSEVTIRGDAQGGLSLIHI